MAITTPSVADVCAQAKSAARRLATLETETKDRALEALATALEERSAEILEANGRDMETGRENGLSSSLLDRLRLDEERLATIARDVRDIAALPDPVGEVVEERTLPNGIRLEKVLVPMGVVAVVYEARPNVTIDCSALCIKSGNAIVLRGSSMAAHSNAALAGVAVDAVEGAGLPPGSISPVTGGDRDELRQIASADGLVDLVIPRGGEGLKDALKEHATVPVMYAAAGNCHVYVDADADVDMAVKIAVNAKVQRPSVCNAAETLVVHADIAPDFLPRALAELLDQGVELRVDGRTRSLAGDLAERTTEASERDWATEFHDLILAVKVVDSRRRGDRPREPLEQRTLRGDRHRIGRRGAGVHHGRRRRLRVRQRVHPVHRRRRVRHGRGDRQLNPETARPRPDRDARALLVQVGCPRRRAGQGVDGRLRIGLFGGAFNPPHVGHLVCAQEAHAQLELDVVVWVPVGQAPHREIPQDPGPEVRLQMCDYATAADERFGLSRIEIDRDGPSYTADTLRELRERSPDDELVLILGGDQAAALPTWHEPEEVMRLATVAVAERGETDRTRVERGDRRAG